MSKTAIILLFFIYSASTITALASPPPIQRVAKPYFLLLFFKACSKVVKSLAPDAPIGCPKAIAPPFIFIF